MKLVEQARRRQTLIETHASWVLVSGALVYKLKKPVDFGFLDFSTLEKRRAACLTEVELNSRLAFGVYLGVVPIRSGPLGEFIDDVASDEPARHGEEPGKNERGPVVEWAVKMRRLSEDDRADLLLRRGLLTRDKAVRLAELLVRFHDRCQTGEHIQSFGRPPAILTNLKENFQQTEGMIARYLDEAAEKEIERLQLDFVERNAELLEARARRGRVRDGHGDLRLEHVYFDPSGIKVIDCIEFNERFRYADVAADLAFLLMDLRHAGSEELAELVLSRYAMESGDYELYRVVDFYEAYRAYVRGKVTAFLDREKNEAQLAKRARSFFIQAGKQGGSARRPRLIVVGGWIASGKSTLCERLSSRLLCPTIDTDRCRKHLAGLDRHAPSTDAAFEGLYSPEMTERVYGAILEQSDWVVSAGRTVIVEGSFRLKSQRRRVARLAERLEVELTFIWCQVPREVAIERLRRRSGEVSVSDGRAEIYDDFTAGSELPDGEDLGGFLTLDTSLSESEQDARLRQVDL